MKLSVFEVCYSFRLRVVNCHRDTDESQMLYIIHIYYHPVKLSTGHAVVLPNPWNSCIQQKESVILCTLQ